MPDGALDAPPAAGAQVHRAVELIGARWNGAILRAVFTGKHRYAEIRATVPGLSDTMLAQRLRELEAAGILRREVVASTPARAEYHLTPMGEDLEPALTALVTWSRTWLTHPEPGPGRTGRAG